MQYTQSELARFRGTQAANLARIGVEVVRLARVAAAVHAAEVAQRLAASADPAAQPLRDQASRLRALAGGRNGGRHA